MRLKLGWWILRIGSRILPYGYGVVVLPPHAMAQAVAMRSERLAQQAAVDKPATPTTEQGGQYI